MLQNLRTTPRRLPIGVSEFDELIKDMRAEYGDELPPIDETSMRFVIATIIMHLGEADSFKPMDFFFHRILAGAAKQVAHHVFREIKQQQEEAASGSTSTEKTAE